MHDQAFDEVVGFAVLPDTGCVRSYTVTPPTVVLVKFCATQLAISFAVPEPFVPNQVTDVDFRLQDVLYTFKKGHRIMVQVQSSWFPAFDRNPQKYVPNIYEAKAADFIKATERVWLDRTAPSGIQVQLLTAR